LCADQALIVHTFAVRANTVYAFGVLRRTPGLTVIAAASLAMGIGGNTVVLGVMDTLVDGGLSFPNADRLVLIRTFPLESPQLNNNAMPSGFRYPNGTSLEYE
jgi:hypothetical protein